ncbi:MAG: DUF1289 domain-containing protein [Burkholderiales bacterium]
MQASGEAERVPTPCVRICCLDPDDVCVGCYRSLSEICAWAEANDSERLAILARCERRRQQRP